MRRAQPERALHNAVAAFLRVALPDSYCWTTFPAGGGGKVRGAQLQAMGLRQGWPDVQILSPWGLSHFIGIELKARRGQLSPEQHECHRRIRLAGGDVFVCRSVEEVEAALLMLGVPLRASCLPKGGRISEFAPVMTLSDLDLLDHAETEEGYRDGLHGEPEPGNNHSRSYWHGWRNGAVDGGHRMKDDAQAALAKLWLARQRDVRA